MKYFVHIVSLVCFQVISMYLKLQTSCFKLSDSIKDSHHECETYFIKITKDTSFSCNKSAKDYTASSWRSISCAPHKHGKILWSCLLPRSITFTQKLDFSDDCFMVNFIYTVVYPNMFVIISHSCTEVVFIN